MSTITWTCSACGKPVRPRAGHVHVSYAAIAEHEQAYAEWRDRCRAAGGGHFEVMTGDLLLDAPRPVRWLVHHTGCDPDLDSHDYAISVERIATHRQLLEWTAHLLEKTWIKSTDWDRLIRQALKTTTRPA